MPSVSVGDISMYYVEAGAGEPVLLIMGFGGDHLAWALQMPAFAERHRVIAYDNRGVGQSSTPDIPYTTAMMANDAAGLLDALGIDAAHVVGVSMGGMIAQELALHHPARVRSLQLHCTYARRDNYMTALSDAWRTVRATLGREEWLRMVALWLFAPATYNERPELVEMVIQNGVANAHPQSLTGFLRQGDAVRTHDALERLGEIRCPTLITVADDDILVPPRFARAIAARMPHAEFRTVPDAGHGYMWERPAEFNRLCLDFIAKHTTAKS
jgi:pimeloyl-ACP methyl ester carboxylesterase